MNIAIILTIVVSIHAVNPSGPVVVNDLVNCLNNFIKAEFVKPGLLIFPHSDNNSSVISRIRNDILKRIHGSNRYTVLVTGPDTKAVCNVNTNNFEAVYQDPFKMMAIANYFILVVNSFPEFTFLARKLIRSRFWNPYAKFLVLYHNITKCDVDSNRKEVENILSCLFKYNVINVAVMVPQAQNVRNVTVYSWQPYDPPAYCGYHNESAKTRLVTKNYCINGKFKYKNSVFNDKLPSDMYGCALNILALERQPFVSRYKDDPNIEKRLVKEMLKPLNFTVNFEMILNKFRGERDEAGEWDGALKQLVARKGQILLGGVFPDYDVHEDFECSATYLADSYTWVVPRANPSPPWSALTAVFEKEVWYLATVVFLTCGFTWKIIGHMSGDTKYNSTFQHCFINSWIVLFGFPAYLRPNKDSLRVFFAFLNAYCILFMTAYQTKLIDVLRYPTFGNQIKTVQDLVQSGLKYGGSEQLHGLFTNSSDPFDYEIDDEWIDVHNITKALLDVVVYRNFSVLCSRLELAYLSSVLPELSDYLGNNNYYVFESSTFLVPLEMISLRGFPFMKKLSHTLNLYKQLGINDYIRRGFAEQNKRKREKLLLSLEIRRNSISPLSIQHLQSGFFVLGLGMFGGSAVLLVEILLNTNFLRQKMLRLSSLFEI